MESKLPSRTGHEGPEKTQSYSSILSSTSALDAGGCSSPLPGHFSTGKETCYLFYRGLSGHKGRSRLVRKVSPPTGLRFPYRKRVAIPTELSRPAFF